jgi:hypothetical protein
MLRASQVSAGRNCFAPIGILGLARKMRPAQQAVIDDNPKNKKGWTGSSPRPSLFHLSR